MKVFMGWYELLHYDWVLNLQLLFESIKTFWYPWQYLGQTDFA